MSMSNIAPEKSAVTAESLRMMAGLYEVQGQYEKAEPYLLRAVRADDLLGDDDLTLIPLYGLCDVYDHLGKAAESQLCWHRATEIMETQVGQDSPDLLAALTSEAKALRQLGRKDEADQLEQRSEKIRRTAALTN
jgi:tetratricopeptide (TPR) repeat protein